jgi:hypothetical protein
MPRIANIQIRRDLAANWTSTNPVLSAGELGIETDTRLAKVGDGATAWTALLYLWADRDLAITDVFTAANQAAMLALTAQRGDVAIRTDLGNQSYILTAAPASTLGNWTLLGQTPVMTGATAGAAGTAGLVPAPVAGQQDGSLLGDATYDRTDRIPFVALSLAASGAVGTVATSVDIAGALNVTATAASLALTLPAPTVTAKTRRIVVANTGATNAFTMNGITVAVGAAANFIWNASLGTPAWQPISPSAAVTALDGGTA